MKKVVLVLDPTEMSEHAAVRLDRYVHWILQVKEYLPFLTNFDNAHFVIAQEQPDLVVLIGWKNENDRIAAALNLIEQNPDVDPNVPVKTWLREELERRSQKKSRWDGLERTPRSGLHPVELRSRQIDVMMDVLNRAMTPESTH